MEKFRWVNSKVAERNFTTEAVRRRNDPHSPVYEGPSKQEKIRRRKAKILRDILARS